MPYEIWLRPRVRRSRQAAGAGGIGRGPRAGSVDHGVGSQGLRTFAVLVADLKGALAALGFGLVEAGSTDGGDAAVRPDHIAQRCLGRQRLDVAFEIRRRSDNLRVRRIPSRRRKQPCGGLVDIVFPGREQLHVPPLPHGVTSFRTSLEHDRRHAALQDVSCRGKSNRTGSDDSDAFGHMVFLFF